LIFGLQLDGWSTGWRAINTSLQILAGQVDVIEMYEVAPVSTVVWYVLFVTCLMFVLINLLLAVSYENHRHIKRRLGATSGIFHQTLALLQDLWDRGPRRCCAGRSRAFPSHRRIAEKLLEPDRSGYTNNQTRRIRSSVLDIKLCRSDVEKAAFVAETPGAEEALNLLNEPVREDLDEMDVDPDYMLALLRGCAVHVEREYDIDTRKTSQLRELVIRAEADMAWMRVHLTQCQEYSSECMEHLTRRLEELEHAVHYTLEELVRLADGAGVSSKAAVQVSSAKRAQLNSTVESLRSTTDALKTQALITGSWSALFGHLSQLEDVSSADGPRRKKDRPKRPGAKDGEPTLAEQHRAFKALSPVGKRWQKSARAEWRKK